MTTVAQRSFSGGEVTPAVYARVDTSKFATGLRTCRNFKVMRHGGAESREGSGYIAEQKDSSKTVLLVPFIFNASQTYVLEFGDLYMRVYKNGQQLTEASQNITGITQANPAVVSITGHGYSNGEEVALFAVAGMTQVNGRNFKVAGVTANTFQLKNMDGTNLNSTGFGAYTSGGSAARVYTIVSPYAYADLPKLKFVQSADVMTFTHPSYPPTELGRTGDISWAFTQIAFRPTATQPTDVTVVSGSSGTYQSMYLVTAVDKTTNEESLPGFTPFSTNINFAPNTYPAFVEVPIHTSPDEGQVVMIDGMLGMTELNGRTFTVSTIGHSFTNVQLVGEDTTDYQVYTSGGTVYTLAAVASTSGAPSPSNVNVVSWTEVANAVSYNIYKKTNGVFGFIGNSASSPFNDDGIPEDQSDNPPIGKNPFPNPNNYPSTVNYSQQRLCFANTNKNPLGVWMSRSGKYKNFTTSQPSQDDDAIQFSLAGRQVNGIEHLLELNVLLSMTSGSEWAINGDAAGIIRPSQINAKVQTYNGSADLKPIVIGGNALYVQARQSIVRDLGFEFQSDSYRGNDLTIYSSHLFDQFEIVSWDYQQIPNSIVWAVRSDGVLLGLTYIREQQMLAWHRHDTDGFVENICVVPEGTEDAVYLVVKRTIGGATKRYVERLTNRKFSTISDFVGMDCSLSYDGRNTDSTKTMTMSGGTTWDSTDTITLTCSQPQFATSDVNGCVNFTAYDGSIIQFQVATYSSTTVVTGAPLGSPIPVALRNVATATWAKAIKTISGLWHLEGKNIAVVGDGFVEASPNNEAYPDLTVTNGSVTLSQCYGVIHAGLPYICDIETLDIDTAQGETIADKKKNISRLNSFVQNSRGLWSGAKPPTDDSVDPLEGLEELKIRDAETYGQPIDLATEEVELNLQSEWNSNGRVFLRQVDPMPLSILSISPAGNIPFSRGA